MIRVLRAVLEALQTRKQRPPRSDLIIQNAFSQHLLDVARLSCEYFDEPPPTIDTTYIATLPRHNKHVGFMTIATHGTTVHIKRLGAHPQHFQEVCHTLLACIASATKIGFHVERSWPIYDRLVEFLVSEGFRHTGETSVYVYYER